MGTVYFTLCIDVKEDDDFDKAVEEAEEKIQDMDFSDLVRKLHPDDFHSDNKE